MVLIFKFVVKYLFCTSTSLWHTQKHTWTALYRRKQIQLLKLLTVTYLYDHAHLHVRQILSILTFVININTAILDISTCVMHSAYSFYRHIILGLITSWYIQFYGLPSLVCFSEWSVRYYSVVRLQSQL